MDADESSAQPDVQEQVDILRRQMAVNRADIDALASAAEAQSRRSQASEAREEIAQRRAEAIEAVADKDRLRIDDLEAHVDIDRELILELQDSGVLNRDQVVQLQQALRTSRTIGAAIGIVMANGFATQEEAFAVLTRASQRSNRKLRDLAEELVYTGDLAILIV